MEGRRGWKGYNRNGSWVNRNFTHRDNLRKRVEDTCRREGGRKDGREGWENGRKEGIIGRKGGKG